MGDVIFSLGVVSGLTFVALFVLVWAMVAGPLQEWLCEVLLDPLHNMRKRPAPDPERLGPFDPKELIVLISDIHLDTWDLSPTKPAAFAEFLGHVKKQGVKELYINGDLLDIPPHPLNQRDVRTLSVDYGGPDHYTDLDGTPIGVL